MRKTPEEKRHALVDEIALREQALAAMERVMGIVMEQGEDLSTPYLQGFIKTLRVQMAMQSIAISNTKQKLEAIGEATNR